MLYLRVKKIVFDAEPAKANFCSGVTAEAAALKDAERAAQPQTREDGQTHPFPTSDTVVETCGLPASA